MTAFTRSRSFGCLGLCVRSLLRGCANVQGHHENTVRETLTKLLGPVSREVFQCK